MSVRIEGVKDLQKAILKFNLDTEDTLSKMVRITALDVMRKATDAIRTVSKGEPVKRGGKTHYISKPGDAPNTDTGRLIDSIDMNFDKQSITAEVGTNVDYGAILELDRNRPWLEPAKDAALDNYTENATRAVNKAIDAAGKRAR